LVSNGVVHKINKVLVPSVLTLPQAIAADSRFTIFNEALIQTGLVDKIKLLFDESYDRKKWLYLDVNYPQVNGFKE